MECLFPINGTLSYINYFRVLQNLLCAFFTTYVSHYFQGITHMNSSGAVGDILVFTFVNLSDNTVYSENRKYISSSNYGKFTALRTLILIVLQLTNQIT